MSAPIKVLSPETRISSIEHSAPLDRTFAVRFKGETLHPAVHRLPIDVPIYRLANMRTNVHQAKFVTDRGAPADFFRLGQENLTAQEAQHLFLFELAKDKDKDIYARLRDEAQGDPLVVTHRGVVVNGNRRLAAMRELFADDPEKHDSFSHVDVVILPADATEDDLTALETDLQIAPDLKLEYSWVAQALGLRRQVDELHWSLKLAAAHWKETEDELAALLNQLALAEQYLTFIGKPRHYDELGSDDLAFQRLLRVTSRPDADPGRAEAERLVGFALISRKDTITGRIWDYAGRIDKITPRVLQAEAIAGGEAPAAQGDEDDPLGMLPQPEHDVNEAVLAALRDSANIEAVVWAARDAYEDLRDEERRSQKGARFAKDAAKLNTDASRIAVANADATSIIEGSAQLLSAAGYCLGLLGQILTSRPKVGESLDRARAEELHKLAGDVLEASKH